MAFCTPCNRGFKDEAALSMHLRGNKAHREPATTMTAAAAAAAATATAAAAAPAPALLVFIWKCVRCGLDFGSRDELRLHILASEDRHFICARCVETGEWLDYLTHRALRSHVWAKHRPDGTDVEGQATEKKSGGGSKRGKKSSKEQERASPQGQATPLDRFFASFAGFAYDAHLSPEASFKLLEHDQGWADRRFGPGKDAWKRYQRALVKEVEMWFGDEHDLAAWWTLCRAVGCLEPPEEIRKCKAVGISLHIYTCMHIYISLYLSTHVCMESKKKGGGGGLINCGWKPDSSKHARQHCRPDRLGPQEGQGGGQSVQGEGLQVRRGAEGVYAAQRQGVCHEGAERVQGGECGAAASAAASAFQGAPGEIREVTG